MKNKSTKLAAFDIDGTIFRSSLLIELVNNLVAERIFPKRAIKEIQADYMAWLNREGEYDKYIQQVVEIFLKNLAGCSYEKVLAVSRRVIVVHKKRVYRYTRDLMKALKNKKFFLLAISGSPTFIVAEFAEEMGFDSYFGTPFETKKGKFTGYRLSTDSFANKDRIVKSLEATHNLRIDYKNSVAVGDTEGDIPMLALVGHPIAFNPNSVLAAHARKRSWKIVVERKDVIYDIRNFSSIRHS